MSSAYGVRVVSNVAKGGDSIAFRHAIPHESRSTLDCAVFRSLVACALAAWVLAGCAAPGVDEPEAKAVQQAHAIAQGMSSTPVTLIAVSSGSLAQLVSSAANTGPDPDRPVWAVEFKGVFELSCGPPQPSAAQTCPVDTTVRVVLDEVTGGMVLAETLPPSS